VDAPAVESIARSPEEQTSLEKRQQQLSKLREMALLLAADVVEHQLSSYLESHGIKQQFGAQERILVCITSRSDAQKMIETGQLVSQRFHGELIVAHVRERELSRGDRAMLDQKLELARAKGIHIEILDGDEPVDSILEFARGRGVTQLFIGHSQRPKLWSSARDNDMDKLIQRSRGMDVRIFPSRQ